MKKQVVISEEDFNKINAMLKGVSYKYKDWGGLSFDDIYQECWLKTMEMIQDWGTIPDLNLICRSCYNRIFDLGRYQARRVDQLPTDPGSFDWGEDSLTDNDSDKASSASNKLQDAILNGSSEKLGSDFESNLIMEEIENLFPEGSKEREFIRELEVYDGLREEFGADIYNKLFNRNMTKENEIARNLGYANISSSGYKSLRWRVRCTVAKFLDI